jgi:predicted PurR-regulated permease PerM
MAQTFQTSKSGRLGMLASIAVIVAALYFAKEVLIPIALAIMLSFLLAPLLIRLQRWGLPRIPALLVVLILLASAVGGLGLVVYSQINDLAGKIDQYKQNIGEKVAWMRRLTHDGAIDKFNKAIKDASTPTTTTSSKPSAAISARLPDTDERVPKTENPVPVFITNQRPAETAAGSTFENLFHSISPLIDPLATAGIVLIFVIFMLIAREDLRDRVIRLIGQGRINVTTQAMDDAAQRVSRYLIAQCIVNGSYGLAIGFGLWLIGLTAGHHNPSFPNWFLWGVLTGLLRFIPYIGPWIGASFPIVISLAVYHGMTVPICVVGMFLLIELISNNVMEPWLYGSSTGVSTMAILVAAVFWTWLWGMPGLLLSTPLTVLIAVTGKYVPQLEFLNILLGDAPALEPKYRFYQRLLAEDIEEAEELLGEYLKEKPVVKVYDEIVLPALSLAEGEWHRDRLDQTKQAAVRQAVRDLIDEVGEKPRKVLNSDVENKVMPVPAKEGANAYLRCVLCIPARDPADEIAAMMLTQVLEREGYCAQYVSVEKLASEYMDLIEKKEVQVVFISALPPAAVTHARYLVKRIRSRFPDVKIVVGLWTTEGSLERPKRRLELAGATATVGSLESAVEQLRQTVAPLLITQTEKAKVTERETVAAQ